MMESHYFYFELSLQNIIKQKALLFIIFFIEYYDTFLHLCEACIYLRNSEIEVEQLILTKNKINIISPLNYLRKLIKINQNSNWAFFILVFVLLYYVFIKVFLYFKKPFSLRVINVIIVNVLDLFISRLFALCIIDLIIYWTFVLIKDAHALLSFVLFVLTIVICVLYFHHIMLYFTFSTGHFDYPFTKATMIYDIFLFVMKIIISLNKNTLEVLRENNQIVYFLNIIEVLYTFSCFCFFAFCYSCSPCYFICNQIFIKQKFFFLLLFTLISVSFLLLNEHTLLFYILLSGIIIFSFIATYSMDPFQRCYSNISHKNLENQLMFIMNLFLMPISYESKYDEEIKRHYIFCKKCPLCKMIVKSGSANRINKLISYHHLFLNLMLESINKLHNKSIILFYDIYDILIKVRGEEYYNYKLQLRLKQLITKYSKKNYYVAMNLKYIYAKYSNEMKIMDLVHFKLISKFDEIISQTQEVIYYIKKISIDIIMTPNEIMGLSILLEQMDKQQQKILNNRDNMQNYSLVLLRIANEELLNTPMSKEEGFMRIEKNYSEDFLNFHYSENLIMVISAEIAKKSYVIVRTGNELIKYLNMELFQLFPKEYRLYAMNKFNNLIDNHSHNNKELFEYIIQRDIDGKNYYLFKFNFWITPGLQSKDFCILGEYYVGSNDIIITLQKNFNCNGNNNNNDSISDVIYWVNSDISTMLFGPARTNKKKEKGIMNKLYVFADMFIKNTILNMYVLNKNEIEFRLTFCFDFELKDNKYKVYIVKTKSLNMNTNGKVTNSINDEVQSLYENGKYKMIDDNKSVFWLDDSSSVNTTSTKSNITTKTLKSREKKHNYQKETQTKLYLNRFKKISNLILIFCLLLICFMFSTLFIELDLNDSIIQLYNIYTNFRAANRLYYTMISNIIGVICIGETNSNNCVRYYELYTLKIIETTNLTMSIFEYILLDNQEKMIEFAERINLLKLNIYQLNDEYCSNLYNQDFNYSLLSTAENDLYLINQTTTFSNALEILVNSMTVIILDPNSTKIPIYAYSTDPYDFSHIYNRLFLSNTQTEYYNSFINYRSYLLTWNSIQHNLYFKIVEKLNYFGILSNCFMIITYVFHLILCGLLYFYLNSFLNLLIFQIDKVLTRINIIENKRFYIQKLDKILGICKLYEENPITIMKNIDKLYYDYFKHQRMNKVLIETKGEEIKVEKHQQYFKPYVYFQLLWKYFYFVFFVFVYYSCLFFIFILLRNLKVKETILVVTFIEEVSYGDSAGFNGLTLIQLMFIANLTESSIGSTLNHEGDDYFSYTFEKGIAIYYSYIKQQKQTDIVNLATDVLKLNCKTFYQEIEDVIINSIDLKYPEMNVKQELAIICEHEHFLLYSDPMVIIKALFYDLLQISKMIKKASFDVYLEIIDKSKIFDIFNTMFLFFQPLRTWINTKIFDSGMKKITNEETVVMIIYLVINNITELVLLALLYFYLIKDITMINKNINRVLCVFKIKHEKL